MHRWKDVKHICVRFWFWFRPAAGVCVYLGCATLSASTCLCLCCCRLLRGAAAEPLDAGKSQFILPGGRPRRAAWVRGEARREPKNKNGRESEEDPRTAWGGGVRAANAR